jgi:hypothetical protein
MYKLDFVESLNRVRIINNNNICEDVPFIKFFVLFYLLILY